MEHQDRIKTIITGTIVKVITHKIPGILWKAKNHKFIPTKLEIDNNHIGDIINHKIIIEQDIRSNQIEVILINKGDPHLEAIRKNLDLTDNLKQ